MKNLYKEAVLGVRQHGFETEPRGQKVKELLAYSMNGIDPYNTVASYPSRKFSWRYLAAEAVWYTLGGYKSEFIGEVASLWKKISNEVGEVHSNYGQLALGNQYDRVLDSIKNDKDTRQAIIHYNRPEHQYEGNKDFPCTVYQQFFIRNDKLYGFSNMRSNDLFYGFAYDIVWFSLVMQSLHIDLKKIYEDLELGTLGHYAGSLHIYENMYEKADKIIREEGINHGIKLKRSLREVSDKIDYETAITRFNDCKTDEDYKDLLYILGIEVHDIYEESPLFHERSNGDE